ncbi:hypothetical protein M885DRAFT_519394 [Pelagophyceae sp. CCMP2097]|nr:hypothetical protein M885DRAFT_519394 [Pelagophyceae sp. CCMP2097]
MRPMCRSTFRSAAFSTPGRGSRQSAAGSLKTIEDGSLLAALAGLGRAGVDVAESRAALDRATFAPAPQSAKASKDRTFTFVVIFAIATATAICACACLAYCVLRTRQSKYGGAQRSDWDLNPRRSGSDAARAARPEVAKPAAPPRRPTSPQGNGGSFELASDFLARPRARCSESPDRRSYDGAGSGARRPDERGGPYAKGFPKP